MKTQITVKKYKVQFWVCLLPLRPVMVSFFKNPFEKNRPVPNPVPRDKKGHGIVATLPAVHIFGT